MDFKGQDILKQDLQTAITEGIIDKYLQQEKYRRFKVGCEVTECEMSELIFLDNIYCKDLCYLNSGHKKTIEQKIKRHGKKM